jgi:hypothetical protein
LAGVYIFDNTPPLGGISADVIFWGKNMKRGREKGGKIKEKEGRGKRKQGEENKKRESKRVNKCKIAKN